MIVEIAVAVRIHRPFDRLDDEICAPGTTENTQRIQLGVWRHAGADGQVGHRRIRSVVAPRVGEAGIGDAVACNQTCRAGAVAAAIKWIRIRVRGMGGIALVGVIIVTGKVIAARDLLGREKWVGC